MSLDRRQHSPSSERNQGPILAQLQRVLPAQARVLEIASGSGQHAAHFAAAQPGWDWLPSDGDASMLGSIAAWCQGLPNVSAPRQLDLLAAPPDASLPSLDAIFCANMLHISPWACCPALMALAGLKLKPAGMLLLYGPFKVAGEDLAPSNHAFDLDLKRRNPQWGLRELSAVEAQAEAVGLHLAERVAMPANNLLLVFGG